MVGYGLGGREGGWAGLIGRRGWDLGCEEVCSTYSIYGVLEARVSWDAQRGFEKD